MQHLSRVLSDTCKTKKRKKNSETTISKLKILGTHCTCNYLHADNYRYFSANCAMSVDRVMAQFSI